MISNQKKTSLNMSFSSKEKLPRVAGTSRALKRHQSLPPINPNKKVNSGVSTRDFSKSKLMTFRRTKELQHVLNDIM